MAAVYVTLGKVHDNAFPHTPVAILQSTALAAETITSSAGATPGTIVVPDNAQNTYWRIATKGDIRFVFGDTPVADNNAANTPWVLFAGQTAEFEAKSGEKISVIDLV